VRFLLGLLLSLIAACGLLIAGFVLLSTWKGPQKPTVSKVSSILLPQEVQASIQTLPPLTPPVVMPDKGLPPETKEKKGLPFETRLPIKNPAQHLILTSLPPSTLRIQVLEANRGKFSARLQEGCYQVRGFDQNWGPLFTVERFCLSPGAKFAPKDLKNFKPLK
jgi:hypothetical protein